MAQTKQRKTQRKAPRKTPQKTQRRKSRQSSRTATRHQSLAKRWRRASLWQRIKIVLITVVALVCTVALVTGTIWFVEWRHSVQAAEARQLQLAQDYGFNPGNIISDGQFFNGNAMSESEVQSFLDEQGAACTDASCLKSKTFDTTDQPADAYCNAYEGKKGERAAAIIVKSARACGISPKVLLTVMQKEQHLVTATNVTDFQYQAAMGLSCPDSANCDPKYAGFFRQVYGAAQRYQYYVAHESQYGYQAKTLNYVQYHPNAACGGTEVYIENKATALLYIYTPYQPNTAALAAGNGEGDSCSSYGNRNFSLIYTSWFGTARSSSS
ncbi:hemagglutinin [Bifidobacterium scaligerum]|nr:hemagglutinin [Bifidobacterium scaligerum]